MEIVYSDKFHLLKIKNDRLLRMDLKLHCQLFSYHWIEHGQNFTKKFCNLSSSKLWIPHYLYRKSSVFLLEAYQSSNEKKSHCANVVHVPSSTYNAIQTDFSCQLSRSISQCQTALMEPPPDDFWKLVKVDIKHRLIDSGHQIIPFLKVSVIKK